METTQLLKMLLGINASRFQLFYNAAMIA